MRDAMNMLVVNLTRFGDLLQSAAAVHALAQKGRGQNGTGPGNTVGVVCIENFAAGAALLPHVDAVFPLPSGRILAALNTAPHAPDDPGAEWLAGVRELHAWVKDITERFAPDAVCNLSPTPSSSLLGRLLAGNAAYSGFTIDTLGYRSTITPWGSFMQGAAAARAASPFNIVDVFRRIAGDESLTPDASLLAAPKEAAPRAAAMPEIQKPRNAKGFLALQLGASSAVRQWPVASFAAVGDAMWQKHGLVPLLLGSRAEKPLGEEYAALATGEHRSLIGETDIAGLAAALSRASLLISNDTGTLHLASGIGIPVLGIYLATAQPWDTGPYAVGNVSLEADIPCHPCAFGVACEHGLACHTAVTPAIVTALAETMLFSGTENFSSATGVRIWKSTRDAHGFADLVSLSGLENTERTQWMRVQRLVYRQFFDGNANTPFVFRPAADPPRVTGETAASLAAGCDGVLALFDALLQQAAMLAEKPIPIVKDRFQRTLDRLMSVLASIPRFAAVAFMWREEISVQQRLEDSIPIMARYREMFRAIRSLV